jgi:hypothetical protein
MVLYPLAVILPLGSLGATTMEPASLTVFTNAFQRASPTPRYVRTPHNLCVV